MGCWNEPKTLQKSSAAVVARNTFRNVAKEAKMSQKRLNSKIICEEEHISNIKKILSRTEQWWTSIPGFHGKFGDTLKAALDDVTDLSPSKVWKAMDHLISLLLKLLLLDTVVIDRDYSNSCGLCLISMTLETTACSVLGHYKFHMKKLVVYGALYPSIVEVILERSTSLKFLAISQMNLTDDLMKSIAKCSELEVLHLMHNYIWIAVSTSALCKGFFNNASEDFVSSSFHSAQNILISFPNLKVLDIGPCMNKFVITFYKWVLYYYKINSVCLSWKTCILEEDRKFSTERVIVPLLDKGKLFHLESLYLNAEFLSGVTLHKIKVITESMPAITQLCLDCNFRNSYQSKGMIIGEKLKTVAERCRNISKFYINISSEEVQTISVLKPFLKEFGPFLRSLTIASEFQGQCIKLSTLKKILLLCPNITQLKLLFLTRYSLRYESEDVSSTFHLPNTKLNELWIHEVSPWDTDQGLSHQTHTMNWISLISILLKLSPRLEILSVTACETMSNLLLKLESRVKNFHLHIKDGCEWNVDKNLLIRLVKRFPNLKNLYLEELDGELFWKIKHHFEKSDLTIHWGNLAGWPRS